jgi:hypothetical protein
MSDYMRVIDTDPELLRKSAEARAHATDETWTHIRGEMKAADGDLDALMETLRSEEPYGYTIQPEINGDGTVRAPIITTREEIVEAYKVVRGRSDLLVTESLIEIRAPWYVFNETYSVGRLRSNGEIQPGTHLLGLFPVSSDDGITGELVWPRVPVEILGTGDTPAGLPTDPMEQRRALIVLHDRFLDAYRAGDADALAETLNAGVQGGVRDYVADTGALTELRGREQAREHYRSLFDKFEILSVQLLDRVVQEWYVFAETRVTARPRSGGPELAYHTAEFSVPAKDGLFMVRVGHGTDLAPQP